MQAKQASLLETPKFPKSKDDLKNLQLKKFIRENSDYELLEIKGRLKKHDKNLRSLEIFSDDFFLIQQRLSTDKVRLLDNFFLNYPQFSRRFLDVVATTSKIDKALDSIESFIPLRDNLSKEHYLKFKGIPVQVMKTFTRANFIDPGNELRGNDFDDINLRFHQAIEAQMAIPFVGYLD